MTEEKQFVYLLEARDPEFGWWVVEASLDSKKDWRNVIAIMWENGYRDNDDNDVVAELRRYRIKRIGLT